MNAHNEQQWPEYLMLRDTGLSDDAGGLGQRIYTTAGAGYEKQKYVRADLAAQPAAAQEAVAYLDIGAGGYLDIGSDLSDEQLLALPKGRHALAIIGTFGIDGYVAAAPTVTDPVAAYERELAAGATHEHALHAICTPAAPGIDRELLRDLIDYAESGKVAEPSMVERMRACLDASPKGGSEARLRTMVVTLAPLWRLSDAWLEASDSPSAKHRAMWGCAKELREKLVQMQAQAGDAEVQP